MESIFIVNTKTSEWDIPELMEDIDTQEAYCIEVLEIPDEKIYGTEMIDKGMLEIVLTDLQSEELEEDWYVNLGRISA